MASVILSFACCRLEKNRQFFFAEPANCFKHFICDDVFISYFIFASLLDLKSVHIHVCLFKLHLRRVCTERMMERTGGKIGKINLQNTALTWVCIVHVCNKQLHVK